MCLADKKEKLPKGEPSITRERKCKGNSPEESISQNYTKVKGFEMNKYEREIEMLNNPRPMVFIGDVILRSIVTVAVGVVIGAIGWLALVGLDRIMNFMGI